MFLRHLDSRHVAGLVPAATFVLLLSGCGSSQVTAETAQEAAQRLPPLPDTALAAVLPVNGNSALAVDMQGLRGSPPMNMMESALAQSCFAATDAQSLFLNVHSIAMASFGSDTAPGFAMAVQGEPSLVSSERLLSTVGHLGYGLSGSPSAAQPIGRLQPKALGSLRAADLAPGLVLVADDRTFEKLAITYDDPERGAPTTPADLQPEKGQLQLWTMDGRGWLEPMGVVPGDITSTLTAAPAALSFRSDADGFHVQLQARLRDEATAKALLQNVHSRLSSASLVMRLMGLPDLSQRIQGRQDGAQVDYRLHLSRDESGRLLTMAQMEAQNRLQAQCEAAAMPTSSNARGL